MTENVSTVNNGGTPVLERQMEMPQLVKALDRAIDDERWDRVGELIGTLHRVALDRLQGNKWGDVHHHVPKLTGALVKLCAREGRERERYFLARSITTLLVVSSVRAYEDGLPLLERISEDHLASLAALRGEVKHSDPGFFFELECLYAAYWVYCEPHDGEGVFEYLRLLRDWGKTSISILKDRDLGAPIEFAKTLREKWGAVPQKWAVHALHTRWKSLDTGRYDHLLRDVDSYLRGRQSGWHGMEYVKALAYFACQGGANSISAMGRLRELAVTGKPLRWAVRFFACQHLQSLLHQPRSSHAFSLNKSLLEERLDKESDRRVKGLLKNGVVYDCAHPLIPFPPENLEALLRSHSMEALFGEVMQLREQMCMAIQILRQMRTEQVRNRQLLVAIYRQVHRPCRRRRRVAVYMVPSRPPVSSPREVLLRPVAGVVADGVGEVQPALAMPAAGVSRPPALAEPHVVSPAEEGAPIAERPVRRPTPAPVPDEPEVPELPETPDVAPPAPPSTPEDYHRRFLEKVPEASEILFDGNVNWREVLAVFTTKSFRYKPPVLKKLFADPVRAAKKSKSRGEKVVMGIFAPAYYVYVGAWTLGLSPIFALAEIAHRSQHKTDPEDFCPCESCCISRYERASDFVAPFPALVKLFIEKFPELRRPSAKGGMDLLEYDLFKRSMLSEAAEPEESDSESD